MEESIIKQYPEIESELENELENKEKLSTERISNQTNLPRKQNRMVAEKTSDMYFGGIMSE